MKRERTRFALSAVAVSTLLLVLAAPVADAQRRRLATGDQAGRMGGYAVVENWPKPLPDTDLPHDGWTWGSGCGAWAESPDKVWICQRGEIELPPGVKPWTFVGLLTPPRTNTGRWPYSGPDPGYKLRRHHVVFAVDRDGKTIVEWLHHDKYLAPPQGSRPGAVSRGPHKILMNPYDPQKHLWIVDDDMHEINVFTNDGTLVKTMGARGVPGRGPNHFNRVTDIAWLPEGTFFVADGYAGVRVAKYDKDGKFLFDWGKTPDNPDKPGPNEFFSVHSIGISRDRRIFVADREHHRMQVFDEHGKFLDMWPTGHNSSVLAHIVTEDDHVWVADWTTDRLVKYDLNGRYILDIGGPGALPGQFDGVHQIHVDQEGNLYVTEVSNDRSQKFRPRPDADPAQLVAPMVGARAQWSGTKLTGGTKTPAAPAKPAAPESRAGQPPREYARVPAGQTNTDVKAGPGSGSIVLVLVPAGTVLPVIGRQGEWLEVMLSPELRKTGTPMRWYRNEGTGFVHESTVETFKK
jgi:NHL repeat